MFGRLLPDDTPDFEGEGFEGLLKELLEPLIQSDPEFQAKIKRRVDEGARDCNCGLPNCPVGKAIRAEYARRNANAGSLTAAQIEKATYDAYMRAQRDFANEQHEKAFATRTWHFGVSLLKPLGTVISLFLQILVTLLSAPFIFVVSTIFWPWVAIVALRRVHVMEIVSEAIVTGEDPIKGAIKRLPWAYRAGFRTGKTIYEAVVSLSARIREAWHNRNWHPISWINNNLASLAAFLRRPRFTRPAVAAQPADDGTAID